MARVGLVAPIFQFWDRPSAQLVAQFDHAVLKNDTRHPFVVQCEQFKTAKLLLQRLQELSQCRGACSATPSSTSRRPIDSVSVDVRGPDGIEHAHRRLSDRRRRRPQHGAQAMRHRVRGLHLARALHRVHHALTTSRPNRGYCSAQLFRRPGRLVQLLQGLGRRPARPVAHGVPDRPVAARGGRDQRRRRAGLDAEILSRRRSPTRSCTAIST